MAVGYEPPLLHSGLKEIYDMLPMESASRADPRTTSTTECSVELLEECQLWPLWLQPLLDGDYFRPCTKHQGFAHKNECNFFCFEPACYATGESLCPICVATQHQGHKVIQIRRSSYHDVVRVNEVTKLLCLEHIQPYVINGARIVFLNERPQARPVKGPFHLCETCERTLQDPVRFCSLGCKLAAIKLGDTSLTLNPRLQPQPPQHRHDNHAISPPTATTTSHQHLSTASTSTKPKPRPSPLLAPVPLVSEHRPRSKRRRSTQSPPPLRDLELSPATSDEMHGVGWLRLLKPEVRSGHGDQQQLGQCIPQQLGHQSSLLAGASGSGTSGEGTSGDGTSDLPAGEPSPPRVARVRLVGLARPESPPGSPSHSGDSSSFTLSPPGTPPLHFYSPFLIGAKRRKGVPHRAPL